MKMTASNRGWAQRPRVSVLESEAQRHRTLAVRRWPQRMLGPILTTKLLVPFGVVGVVVILAWNYKRIARKMKRLHRFCCLFCFCSSFGEKKGQPPRIRNSPKNQSTEYLGLRNEGSTCYLNSLLQCLFMTPEFTNGILRHSTNEPGSIVYELQYLFVKLQYGKSPPSTRNLMSCLGIRSGRQQDVEEHFRLLINKIPRDITDLKLFPISVVHSITCRTCKYADIIPNTMLCLPLSIQMAKPSVKEALQVFLKEQDMDGNNQCYCDRCERKQDAVSCHYFEHLPRILVIHLKRYEIYMGRFQKICESVSVPNSLTVPFGKSTSGHGRDSNLEQKLLLSQKNSQENHKKKESVEYELFALCHHYGGLGGGHYAAEIKSFENDKWYTFNDEHVNKNSHLQDSTEKDKSSETAYLLMYRQKQLGRPEFMEENLAKHVQDWIDKFNNKHGIEHV